jgi:hypothetical protein
MLRHSCPDFDDVASALSSQSKAELSLARNQARAFGLDLRKYAGTQKGEFVDDLLAVAEAGGAQSQLATETNTSLQAFRDGLEPVRNQESEYRKWQDMAAAADATAARSRAAVATAKANLNALKAKKGTPPAEITKAEVAVASASRKAEADDNSAIDLRQKFSMLEGPYRKRWLQAFKSPLVALINARYAGAEKMVAVAEQFQTAAARMHIYDDKTIEGLQKKLQEVEEAEQAYKSRFSQDGAGA